MPSDAGRVSSRAVRILLATVLALSATSALAADSFTVVAHVSVQGTNVRRADLAAVFLKKAGRWGDGTPALPVDQSGTSPVRESFSQAVLQMPVTAVVQYWQRQIMNSAAATRPPIVKGSDAEVLDYVVRTHGAVGYVKVGTTLPPGVKALAVID